MIQRRVAWVALLALLIGCTGERTPAKPTVERASDVAPAAAPAPDPSPGARANDSPTSAAPTDAAPLAFVEQVTADADPARPLPLIIAVHGLGDRPESFIRLFDGLPFPARIVAPRGPIAHGRGHSWFPVQIPVRRDDPEMARGIRSAADRLAALAVWLARHRPTVGRPLITGFSQGGISSFAVAVHHPDAVAGAVPMAGALPSSLWAGSGPKVPLVALHGTADRVVPFADGEALVQALADRGAPARLIRFEGVAHHVPPAMRRALFEALAEMAPAGR